MVTNNYSCFTQHRHTRWGILVMTISRCRQKTVSKWLPTSNFTAHSLLHLLISKDLPPEECALLTTIACYGRETVRKGSPTSKFISHNVFYLLRFLNTNLPTVRVLVPTIARSRRETVNGNYITSNSISHSTLHLFTQI